MGLGWIASPSLFGFRREVGNLDHALDFGAGDIQFARGDFVIERINMAQWWADYLDRLRNQRSSVVTILKR